MGKSRIAGGTRKYRTGFIAPPVRTTYSQLRLTLESQAGMPGAIDLGQADRMHRQWKRLGKLVSHGPAVRIK